MRVRVWMRKSGAKKNAKERNAKEWNEREWNERECFLPSFASPSSLFLSCFSLLRMKGMQRYLFSLHRAQVPLSPLFLAAIMAA